MSEDDGIKLDFEKSRKRIVGEDLKGNNPVPDILGFLHLKSLLGSDFSPELYKLIEAYTDGSTNISPLLKIDVPKANFTIRPMARPEIKDWLIYEAIINYLSNKILNDTQICARSFSILNFKNKNSEGTKKTNAWLKFDEHSREFYNNGYKYAVVADLTGYYENVNLEELRNRIINCLEGCSNGVELINVLFKLLRKWSDERIPGCGLPQGPPASSFLADIFLDYVDRKMEKYDGYFRYMDDMRIFCKREIDTKIALKDLIISLRELKLNINAKKTKILIDEEIDKKLFDPHKSLLNIIDATMKTKDRKQIENIIPHLAKLFKDSFSSDPFEKTHLNFSLYRLSILHASGFDLDIEEIIEKIENNFVSKPHHMGLFCNFLSMFHDNIEIAKFLISFLQSENNIYDWQEVKVLHTLLRFNIKFGRPNIDFFISSARDSNKHYAARSFYFLLAGKNGSNRDRELIVSCYNGLSKIFTKMAIILAVQEIGLASRNQFYSWVTRNESNKEIQQFIKYVKSLSNPIYYLAAERLKIEMYEAISEPSYESM